MSTLNVFGPKYRYFDGHRYRFLGRFETMKKANDIADNLRKNNCNARVVEYESDYYGKYYVYVK